MHWINKYNLPPEIINSLGEWRPRILNRMSVTDLINPPLMRTLMIKYGDKIEQDVSEMLWAIRSNALHHWLQRFAGENTKTEFKIEKDFDGITLVGILDLIRFDDKGIIIEDWKDSSVWSYLFGVKPEWEKQLNVYATLAESFFEQNVYSLNINLFIKDWDKRKLREKDYPRIPFAVQNVKLWSKKERIDYIDAQLKDHKLNPERECSAEEKWEKPTKYAVMKANQKRAVRVFDNEVEAGQYIIDNKKKGKMDIVVRPGECTRCEYYCPVRDYCKYNSIKYF